MTMVLLLCAVVVLVARAPRSWYHFCLLLCSFNLSQSFNCCYTSPYSYSMLTCVLGWQVTERDILIAGESGIFTPEDVAFVQSTGCGAILVGESLVKTGDPAAAVRALLS